MFILYRMSQSPGSQPSGDSKARQGPIRRFLKWPIRLVLTFAGLILLYLLSALVLGLIPTNSNWVQSKEGTRIYIITNGVHTSFVLPTGEGESDLLAFVPFKNAPKWDTPYVEFGWGDRGFYLETPAWSDLKLSTALNAVFLCSSSVVHVRYEYREPELDGDSRRVILNAKEYKDLLRYIKKSFALDSSDRTQRIPDAHYGSRDAFFQGRGSYHLFNTCNGWTNAGLKAAGVKTALWSPFDKAILYQLPRSEDDRPEPGRPEPR